MHHLSSNTHYPFHAQRDAGPTVFRIPDPGILCCWLLSSDLAHWFEFSPNIISPAPSSLMWFFPPSSCNKWMQQRIQKCSLLLMQSCPATARGEIEDSYCHLKNEAFWYGMNIKLHHSSLHQRPWGKAALSWLWIINSLCIGESSLLYQPAQYNGSESS